MKKAYLLAIVKIHDQNLFSKFIEETKSLVDEYGGKVLVRNLNFDLKEGNLEGLVTIIEFKNIKTAKKFYDSKVYTDSKIIRIKASKTDLLLVEGI
tara:strand:- start:17531 stop:17818 length:288 start_codon:yes stop_codon:yes gene_type:complete